MEPSVTVAISVMVVSLSLIATRFAGLDVSGTCRVLIVATGRALTLEDSKGDAAGTLVALLQVCCPSAAVTVDV